MITINFASRNYRLTARIVTALAAAGFILLLAGAGLLARSMSLQTELIALQQKVRTAETDVEKSRETLQEREQLIRDLNSMSALLTSRKFSWTRMLTQLEAVVPTGAALNKVSFNPKDRVLSLEGAAQSPEALRNLIVSLERSKAFSDPYLKHQSLDKGILAFYVVAVYQEKNPVAAAQRAR